MKTLLLILLAALPAFSQVSVQINTNGTTRILTNGTISIPTETPAASVYWETTEEWIGPTAVGELGWTLGATGTGSISPAQVTSIATADSNRWGLINLVAGTTATGYSVAHLGQSSVKFSGGEKGFEVSVKTPAIVAATSDYYVRVGFHDAITQAVVTDGVYFEWHADSASQGWRGCAANNSNGTTNKSYTSASSAIAATTWYKLKAVINSTGTSVVFYLNDVALGSPLTTNIPTASGRQCGPNILIGSYGTAAAKTLVADFFFLKNTSSPGR